MSTQGSTFDSFPALQSLHDDACFYVIHNDTDYKVTAAMLKALVLANLPPAELPPGLVNEDSLNVRLESYLTQEQINQAITAAVEAIPQYTLPEDVVRTADLEGIQTDLEAVRQAQREAAEVTYVTPDQLSQMFADYVPTIPSNVVREEALQVLADRVTALENATHLSQGDLDDLQQTIEAKIPQGPFVSPDMVVTLEQRVQAVEVKEVVTPEQLIAAIEAIPAPEVVDLSGLATKEELTGLVTSEQLSTALETLEHPVPSIPENLVTTEQLATALEAVQIPEDLVKQDALDAVDQRLQVVEAKETVTPQELQAAIEAIPAPEAVDLSGLATKEELQTALESIEHPVPEIPADVVRTSDLQEAIEAIPQVQVPDVSEFVTEAQMIQAISNIGHPVPELPANLVTTEQLSAALEALPEGQEPVDLSSYATKAEVEAAIEQIEIPAPVDVSNLATKDEVAQVQAGIPSVVGFATQESLDLVSQEQINIAGRVTALEEVPAYELPSDVVREDALNLKLSKPAQSVNNAVLMFEDDALVQKSAQMARLFYVNALATNPNEDGSVFAPFKTIQAALNAAPVQSTILVAPGAYNEVIIPTKANVLVQGFGCFGSNQAEIRGQVKLTGASLTRFRLKDIQIRNTATDVSPLVMEGGQLRHYFNNVTVELMAGTTVPAVDVYGDTSNWVAFFGCDLGGEVRLGGNPAVNTAFYFNSGAHASFHLNMVSAYNVAMHDMVRLNGITHATGNLGLTRVTGFGAVGLNSTAPAGVMKIEFSSLRKDDGSFAPYSVAGATVIEDYFVRPQA